mmetsp:Transcript_31371/g.93873  ORF Transcript_31371/g.93873 Transcript_31371/m.93873 type:complete len:561 (-) Transcript_31371:130-1812(-)|eukprot:CAMPEP_0113563294 /NCGR_PEP_ID=MMETSP0015_2-20120614/20993_1 /TAXON_ID=2838 /ORGANISM="Odontella" /LENGTH=560 /DNA_ID=CAMNT_0000465267 /DNA_START=148 /DNA_END=1830 /DNA_ORIENTATION=+ /assembly_acc=CAM_ASM_000160
MRAYNSVGSEDEHITELVGSSDRALELEHPMHNSEVKIDNEINNEDSSIIAQVPANVQLAQRLIYASHFISQFSECAWQFAVVLFLATVSHYKSILLVSSYYLTTYVAVMLFGAPIGSHLDHSNRLQAARLCIVIENGAVLLATFACCWLLTKTETAQQEDDDDQETVVPHDTLSIVLIVAIHFFGSLAMLFNQGFVVAIERDWIVVLSQQTTEQEAWLSRTNVALRQIYLSCKVLSPTFAGWIVGGASLGSNGQHRFCDLHNAAVMVGGLCVISLLIEYICTDRVYRLVPALALLQQGATHQERTDPPQESHDDKNNNESFKPEACHAKLSVISAIETTETTSCSIWRSFAIYWEQPIVWAGLSLAFMNSNALCFGGAMTTFLLWEGMPVEEVGLWRGLSSAIGLAGTFAYNWSARHTTVVNTGAWSVVYLFFCLTIACSSFLIGDYQHTSVFLLVASTSASRIGLWVFDISVTLLYQEMIPDGVRGRIGGTQQSINSFFTMASGCLGLFFRKPEEFFVIATAGYICIGISMLLYLCGVYRRGQQFFKPLNQQLSCMSK